MKLKIYVICILMVAVFLAGCCGGVADNNQGTKVPDASGNAAGSYNESTSLEESREIGESTSNKETIESESERISNASENQSGNKLQSGTGNLPDQSSGQSSQGQSGNQTGQNQSAWQGQTTGQYGQSQTGQNQSANQSQPGNQNGQSSSGNQDSNKPTQPQACVHSWDSGTIQYYATCVKNGVKIVRCVKCGEEKQDTIAASGHEVITDFGYPASCMETGLSDGSHCLKCGEILTPQYVLEKTDHNWIAESVWVGGYLTCYCGAVFYDSESYFEHFRQQESAAEHGCVSTSGYQKYIYTCTMCGTTIGN